MSLCWLLNEERGRKSSDIVQTIQQIRLRLVNILPPANVVRGIRLPRKKFPWTSGKPAVLL